MSARDLTARLRAKRPCCPDGPSMAFMTEAADHIDAQARRIEEMPWAGDVNAYQDWLNDLMDNAGDEWDGDDSMEAIATRYVHHIEYERDAALATISQLREALEQAQPWLHYMRDHIAPDWSRSEAEVLRQDVALVDARLADTAPEAPCSTCGGSGLIDVPEGRGDVFPDPGWHRPCPDCTEEADRG